ncbi:iron-containing alcohol dehydrogenase [Herbiconiux sp. CPCC 203407]|uniref:Glycerol dehydrogenase n=1 Tax=Herbiconiux oxytropis TaxID=2970915 RepID=A0AA42BUP5_9MICO|nr:iron-containing alcohol dehydrogenase [Herbiconiux oxytropis]MCS5722845.1 iron-containing alcohol dehydrogenase [Herbiconiux oxytropis]MCS5727775.1 iron-containing alcohol dehydrogenase [Herbiconiux oxytropis]
MRATAPETHSPGIRAFATAARYVQGPGALERIGGECKGIGGSALVLIDAFLLPTLAPGVERSFAAAGIEVEVVAVSSEVTSAAIAAISSAAAPHHGFVVGVGGGKTVDLAKGVSRLREVPVVTVPTIASNDSPASRAIAVYDDAHQLQQVPQLERSPALVLVDTAVIAGAPRRFLAAGIGDALSKHFEVAACRAAGGITMQGTRGLRIAAVVAEGCYDVLRSQSAGAFAALEADEIDEAFEDTVEAVILLSGLAFENGGLSLAHAVTRGLMALPGPAERLHGEHVAYGLLVQLAVLGEDDTVLLDLADYLGEVGLPRSLRELGAEADEDALAVVAEKTLTAPHVVNLPEPLTEAALLAALRRVEELTG